MQKGEYKCLFCSHVFTFVCECERIVFGGNRILPCANGHNLSFELPVDVVDFCLRCKIACVQETPHVFWLEESTCFTLPGRQTKIVLYDLIDKIQKEYSIFALRRLSRFQQYSVFAEYEQQQTLLKAQIDASRRAWLLCALRIGKNLVNKDIRRKIAALLNTEPFVFCKQE